jgi:hypothetical protein
MAQRMIHGVGLRYILIQGMCCGLIMAHVCPSVGQRYHTRVCVVIEDVLNTIAIEYLWLVGVVHGD